LKAGGLPNVAPGQWRITQGVSKANDGKLDSASKTQEFAFEKSASIDIDFPAGRTTVLQLERIAEATPVELRPDLGIGHGDVRVTADAIEVTVHSLGHADAPAGFVVLEDARGKELARSAFPALAAPRNLQPITAQVRLPLTNAANLKTAQVRVVTESNAPEITDLNNHLALPTPAKSATAKNSQ
ncbi:LamG domain-containing protein, partial [Xanthomonas phaseoli pv. dieffenbachiae]|nr:LamG domain-containing protein [Xanthomonas phaseoli pv. dieffenbachiae]MBO9806456.1 LamG domain-containing protein [Xanthomonas phaseoli pv. dieffenbachiae]MBO9814520.1 LamG domain-containing protein [Xanthomonas phaseoli pv. dieffenbachiae]MBO9818568.1 LamG domain-containing protein [Xanthomonas phaseoli pv. dieffenbachiae]MBO9822564.1 LamG domain-containing protein [Xanthomonas phaseoli pv. dieffenbachiae]